MRTEYDYDTLANDLKAVLNEPDPFGRGESASDQDYDQYQVRVALRRGVSGGADVVYRYKCQKYKYTLIRICAHLESEGVAVVIDLATCRC